MGRILIVDDEADVRSILSVLLAVRGHIVSTASDGLEALASLGTESFDAVVLDIMLPGMSGLEVLDAIRGDSRYQQLPVLILSADSEGSSRARSLCHGADDFVAKPFETEELTLRLERLIERSRGFEALFSGHDRDRLRIEVLADAAGFARVEPWLRTLPEPEQQITVEAIELRADRADVRFRHATGRAELVLRLVSRETVDPIPVAADALFCVLLVLGETPQDRRRESRLLAELARERPLGAELIWISSAPEDELPVSPWQRAPSVPSTLEELLEQLLPVRGAV